MNSCHIIHNETELKTYASEIAKQCSEQYCIALHGALGVGKTTFVKYLGQSWNIFDVKSPSFDIVNIHIGQRRLIHMDAYRLNHQDLTTFAIDDLCTPPFCLIVEWPECLPTTVPFNLHLYFSILSDSSRQIITKKTNDAP